VNEDYLQDPTTGARLANSAVTITDASNGTIITDLLDRNGQPATSISSDADGFVTFAAPAAVVRIDAGFGPFEFYSSSLVQDVIAMAPQLDTIQASAAASAYSASLAQAAATAAVAGASAPANTAIDAHLGGDATGLVTTVAGKADKNVTAFSVVNFGAKGDGTTDDTAAIQAALDYGTSVFRGRVVTLPPKTYRITGYLTIPANTTLSGYGARLLRDGNVNAVLRNFAGADAFNGYAGKGNILLEGFTLDMQGFTYGLDGNGITFGHGQNITMRDVTVKDTPRIHALELNGCKDVLVERCHFLGYCDVAGDSQVKEAVQIDLPIQISGGGVANWDYTACADLTFTGCTFGYSDTPGSEKWPRAIGSHSAVVDRPVHNVKIRGCTFDDIEEYAIKGYNWSDVEVAGNVFRRVGAVIELNTIDPAATGAPSMTVNAAGVDTHASAPCSNVDIHDNEILGTTAALVIVRVRGYATGNGLWDNVNIHDNTIRDGFASTAAHGIRVDYVEDGCIHDNTIKNVGGNGISTVAFNKSSVHHNKVRNAATVGIGFNISHDSEVSYNDIRGCGNTGINIGGANQPLISFNKVIGNAQASGTFYGINVTFGTEANSAQARVVEPQIIGNKVRITTGATNNHNVGLRIDTYADRVMRYGNDLKDSGATALSDTSTSPVTAATDRVA